MRLTRLVRANQDHSRLFFETSEGKSHSVVVPDHALSHPLTAVRHLREQGVNYRPPAGVCDRGKWHELLASVKDASFGAGPQTVTAPSDSDYRSVVSRVYSALKNLLDSGSADPDEVRAALVQGVGALDALDRRRKGPAA